MLTPQVTPQVNTKNVLSLSQACPKLKKLYRELRKFTRQENIK